MDKILPIWKPRNITSYDVIRSIKKFIGKDKIGHCGTLDPFAEGLLIICIGKLTKEISTYMNKQKKYKAVIKLGEETDTLDCTGKVINSIKPEEISIDRIQKVLNNFIGDIKQIPPYFSAKKIHGVKLYTLARKDIFIRRRPSKVSIYNIKLESYKNNKLTLIILCGKGTYIRSLARDISYSLNTCGYLEELERMEIGAYNKDNSIKLEEVKKCLLNIS